jgi:hypothetical protein
MGLPRRSLSDGISIDFTSSIGRTLEETKRPTTLSQLETLAAVIKDGIAAGDLLMFKTQEHYRQAGGLLPAAKSLASHGRFEQFLEDHCLLRIETTSNEMRTFVR